MKLTAMASILSSTSSWAPTSSVVLVPFLCPYASRCVLIDTGCGTGADYRAYVTSTVNRTNLPYLVVWYDLCSALLTISSTHVHFDHTGGNFRFSGANAAGCRGICMGGADQTFSRNCKINSLCMAHNATIRDFEVTRWLAEGMQHSL